MDNSVEKLDKAIQMDRVSKRFGDFTAVNELSLTVPLNCIYGFIGPNGSGKTTTLRMILRIYFPDEGTIEVLGRSSLSAANHEIGYLPEERGLYKKMKVGELLQFYASLKGMNRANSEIDSWLERMGLQEWKQKKIEALSKGMAQKIQFIATILAKPKLVVLDEPFSGLDPVNAEVLRDAVLSLKREGSTVIFSTHDMSVAEKMCDFIFMIYKGNKVLDGTLVSIQNVYGQDTIRVRLEGKSLYNLVMPGIEKVVDFGHYQELRKHADADSQEILAKLMQMGRVLQFEQVNPSLEDIFKRIVEPLPILSNSL